MSRDGGENSWEREIPGWEEFLHLKLGDTLLDKSPSLMGGLGGCSMGWVSPGTAFRGAGMSPGCPALRCGVMKSTVQGGRLEDE